MLKNKFALKISASIILPILLISLIAAPILVYIIQGEFKENILNTASSQVKASAANTNSWLRTYQNYLQILAKQNFLIENIQDLDKAKEYLNSFPSSDKNINRIVLIGASGDGVFIETDTKIIKSGNFTTQEIYQKIVVQGDESYLSNGLKGPLSGVPIAIVGHSIKDASGKTLGLISFGIVLEKMDEQTRNIKITNSIYNWILDGNDAIMIHPDRSKNLTMNLKNASNNADALLASAKFANQIKNQKANNGVEFFKGQDGVEYVTVFSKIDETPNWIFGSTFKRNELFYPAKQALVNYMLVVFVVLTVSISITLLLTFVILSPLKTLLVAMQNMASGEVNLTQRINITTSKDELGVLTLETNKFIKNLNELIVEVLEEANQVSTSVAGVSQTTKDIFSQAQKTNSGIFDISTAMREMVRTSEDISKNTESAADQVKQANTDTDAGVVQLQDVIKIIENQARSIEVATKDIEVLQADGKQITEVMEVINSIADQTNLLALNAAIEAARAGESGKGFAVVADEVRGLALRTHQSTTEIQSTISSLNNSIDSAANAMEQSNAQAEASVNAAFETGGVLERINESIQKVEDMNIQIASSTQQQAYTSEELSVTLERIADFSQKTQDELKQIVNSTEQLQHSSQQLKNLMTRFKVS